MSRNWAESSRNPLYLAGLNGKKRFLKIDMARFIERDGPCLWVSDRGIRAIASQRNIGRSLAAILLRQAWYEYWVRFGKNLHFRSRAYGEMRRAYSEMTLREFEGVNARQRWANWRTIPRNLRGRLRNRPTLILDLCSGVGHSTEVLACYAPPGSSILGLENNPDFVKVARRREYTDERGRTMPVLFHAQSVLEPFRSPDGRCLPGESVGLVNSSGAVGVHFAREDTRILAREIRRVLQSGGLAMIDSGPEGTSRRDLIQVFQELGFEALHWTRSCPFDRYSQVCFRKK